MDNVRRNFVIGTFLDDIKKLIPEENQEKFSEIKGKLHEWLFISWHIDDVKERRPDLTKEECSEVLDYLDDTHDAEHGVSWDAIESASESLYGEPPEEDETEE